MTRFRQLLRRFRALFQKDKLDARMDEEMRAHIEMQEQEHIEAGMKPEEARYAAMRQFGSIESIKETCRDQRGLPWLEMLWQDIRYGARQLRKDRGFTAVAVLTLGLGIGANTAIFTLTNALLLRPLPGVEKPDELVLVGRTQNGSGFDAFSYPDYADLRDLNSVFSGVAAYRSTELVLTDGRGDETTPVVDGALVSHQYFSLLGARAARGRVFTRQDETAPGADHVCVISDGLWKRSFGSDPGVVGETIKLNGHGFTIIGVMNGDFSGTEAGQRVDAWLPITMYAEANPFFTEKRLEQRHIVWLRLFGRLKTTVSFEQAQAEMPVLSQRLEQANPAIGRGFGIQLFRGLRLGPQSFGEVRRSAVLMMTVVAVVLLIGCANVANLLMARGASRQREIGIRLTLGASRGRVIRQLLTEALILSLLGGAVGLFIACGGRRFLLAYNPLTSATTAPLDLGLDGRVLCFTVLVSLATAIVFGLVPAWQASRAKQLTHLKERNAGLMKRSGFVNWLVAGQVALSFVALIVSGLLVRTLQKTQSIDPGFDSEKVLFASLELGRNGYTDPAGSAFYQQVVDRFEAFPQVASAGLAVTVPLGPSWRTGFKVEGSTASGTETAANYNVVTPGYLKTMGIPLLAGRDFNTSDRKNGRNVAIVNEAFSRRLFQGENPVGKRLLVPRNETEIDSVEIIGMAKDTKYRRLIEDSQPYFYLCALQQYQPSMVLHVRAEGDRAALIGMFRRQLRELDARFANLDFRPVSERLELSLRPQRRVAGLTSLFALVAVVLASVGLYGVMAYVVSQRTKEIGVRMAIGATTRDVSRLILGEGLTLVTLGIGLGLTGAIMGTRWLAAFLHGVTSTDPMTFLSVITLFGTLGLLACWLPARRAAKVDPMVALRCE